MTAPSASDIDSVRRGRILFGHHSVGSNVLAGLARFDVEAGGGRLRIAPWEQLAFIEGPVLAHGAVGRNGEPRSKLDEFAALVRRNACVELAFMKFCYVDFKPATDVAAVFEQYRRTLESLQHEHPEIVFAHVTVPLTIRPTSPKARLHRLLGQEVWEDAANATRSEFSRRLREAFVSDPVFDLALVESAGPDDARSGPTRAGAARPSLDPCFTDDGGHLNERGQRAAGAEMVRFLARALRSRGKVR